MTINSFSDITQQYEVTLDNCPCKGFTRWGHCQHNEVLKRAYARAKAATFADMRQQYDVRSEAQQAARREAYCVDFAIYG